MVEEVNRPSELLNQNSNILNDSLESLSHRKRAHEFSDILNHADINNLLLSMDNQLVNRIDISRLIESNNQEKDKIDTSVLLKPSISSCSSISNLLEDIDKKANIVRACETTATDEILMNTAAISRRAQWDKSMHEINYKSQFLNSLQVFLLVLFIIYNYKEYGWIFSFF